MKSISHECKLLLIGETGGGVGGGKKYVETLYFLLNISASLKLP